MKIRIAVAVNANGNWCVAGWKGCDLDEAMKAAASAIPSGQPETHQIVEMEVPDPPRIRPQMVR